MRLLSRSSRSTLFWPSRAAPAMDLASTQSGPRLSVHSTLGASGAALRTHRNADDDLTSDRHLRELQRFMGAEDGLARSEERRVGKEGVRTGRSRWAPYN